MSNSSTAKAAAIRGIAVPVVLRGKRAVTPTLRDARLERVHVV
jgi:hypothetical protein